MVARFVHTEEVTGSNPVSPTKLGTWGCTARGAEQDRQHTAESGTCLDQGAALCAGGACLPYGPGRAASVASCPCFADALSLSWAFQQHPGQPSIGGIEAAHTWGKFRAEPRSSVQRWQIFKVHRVRVRPP